MLASFDYTDLGGGVNRGVSADRIPSRQAAELINFYPYGTHLKRRGGNRGIAAVGAFNPTGGGYGGISGMIAYSPDIGTWHLLVASDSQFGRVNGDHIDVLPISGADSIAFDSTNLGQPWCAVQYKKYTYWMRKTLTGSGNRMYRVNAAGAARAGIAAPTAAATIAAGAAGVLTAANYRAVYTYYNQETALESNPAPVSNTLALGANLQIDYTGISVSSNPFVNARRIYRTIPDQVGVYFFVSQINDNLTTTFTGDNVAVADLGRPVSFDNGLPPGRMYIGDIWGERLFCSDGLNLYFSEFLLPECFGVENIISIFPDDGHKITAIRAFGDRLIVAKTNAIHYLTGTDSRNFALATLVDRHGCASQSSMKVVDNQLFWLASDRAVYKSDGTSVKKVSDPQVTEYLAEIADSKLSRACAGVVPERNWCILNVDDDGVGPAGTKLLVYNYKEDTWTVFQTNTSQAIPFMASFFDANGSHRLYGATSALVLHLADETYNYDDSALSANFLTGLRNEVIISASVLLKSDDFGLPGRRKGLRSIGYLADYTRLDNVSVVPDLLGLSVYGEGDTTSAILSRSSIYMDDGGNYHRIIAAGTMDSPSTRFQVKLSFLTVFPTLLKEVKFNVSALKRFAGQPQ